MKSRIGSYLGSESDIKAWYKFSTKEENKNAEGIFYAFLRLYHLVLLHLSNSCN